MKKFKIGLQLYSIREAMAEDMDAALKAVKEMGYDYVEFAGYFDKSAEEIKALLDKYGLKAISVHQNLLSCSAEEKANFIKLIKGIDAEYCALPWYFIQEYVENWDNTIKAFSDLGTELKENGLKFLYHNHEFEFKKVDDEFVLDKLYRTIPADIFNPEFDTCWVHYAGNNPAEYIKKYSGRMDIVHIKDFVCEKLGGGPMYALVDKNGEEIKNNSREENGFKFRPIGEGIQDWDSILKSCEECGVQYLIVEQDAWHDDDPMDCARRSREFLKNKYNI